MDSYNPSWTSVVWTNTLFANCSTCWPSRSYWNYWLIHLHQLQGSYFYTEVAQNYSSFHIYAFCVTLKPQNLSVCLILLRQPWSQARTQKWAVFHRCCLILHLSTQGFMIKRKSHNPLHIESRCGAQLLLHLLNPWFPASKHLLSLTAPNSPQMLPRSFCYTWDFQGIILDHMSPCLLKGSGHVSLQVCVVIWKTDTWNCCGGNSVLWYGLWYPVPFLAMTEIGVNGL